MVPLIADRLSISIVRLLACSLLTPIAILFYAVATNTVVFAEYREFIRAGEPQAQEVGA